MAWFGMTFPSGLVSTLRDRNPALAVLFHNQYPGDSIPVDIPVHPTPLYESLSQLALLAILLLPGWKIGPGRRFAMFLAWFGVSRFLVEFIRLNPVVWGGLTSDQLLSAGEILLGILVLRIGKGSGASGNMPQSQA